MKTIDKLLAGILGGVVVTGLFQLIISLPFANQIDLQGSVLFHVTLGLWCIPIFFRFSRNDRVVHGAYSSSSRHCSVSLSQWSRFYSPRRA